MISRSERVTSDGADCTSPSHEGHRFDYLYIRKSGPVPVTVQAVKDQCVEQFGDEKPFARHHHWTHADAAQCVAQKHAAILNPATSPARQACLCGCCREQGPVNPPRPPAGYRADTRSTGGPAAGSGSCSAGRSRSSTRTSTSTSTTRAATTPTSTKAAGTGTATTCRARMTAGTELRNTAFLAKFVLARGRRHQGEQMGNWNIPADYDGPAIPHRIPLPLRLGRLHRPARHCHRGPGLFPGQGGRRLAVQLDDGGPLR